MAEKYPAAAERDRQHLRAILDTAPECITLLTRDALVIEINPAGLTMLEANSLDAIRGVDLSRQILPNHRARFLELLASIFAGQRGTLEFEITGLASQQLWVHTHGAPLWRADADQSIEAALFITRDITERVAAEEQRRVLEEQLRQSQKMEAVGRLAGGIAHDFNNLLTIIQGQISLITATASIDHELETSLQSMTDATQRAAALIRQLLTFSRRQRMQARDLDLAVVVTNLSPLLRTMLGDDIVLETRLAAHRMFVHADPTMMEQVILNLAVNARDAMPDGGQLTIALDRLDSPRAQKTDGVASFIRLQVTDTGIGIRDEDLPHVFEPFFTTKDVGQGSGLGLATTFGILEQHRGRLEVQSEPGHGTTFTVTLPAVDVLAA
jgi:two-component system cell cycle sensor histidine kinase/response regulator CckA